MFRLPPAMRYMVTSRTLGQSPLSAGFVRTVPQLSALRKHLQYRHERRYATVDTTETDRLWSKRNDGGVPAPSQSEDKEATPTAPAPGSETLLPSAGKREHAELRSFIRTFRNQQNDGKRKRRRWKVTSAKLEEIGKLPEAQQVQRLRHLAKVLRSGTFWTAFPEERPKPAARTAPQVSAAASTEQSSETQEDPEPAGVEPPAMTMSHIQATLPLPSRGEYPKADPSLFEMKSQANAFNNKCQALGVGMQIDLDCSERKLKARSTIDGKTLRKDSAVYTCAAKLDIPDICQETAIGEGATKQTAKHAAWLHLTSKMHVSGALKELWPEPEQTVSTQEDTNPKGGKGVEATHVDKATMSAERDAKIDIYNYAAGFGLLPIFETSFVRGRPGRQRRGVKGKQPVQLYQTNIKLPERDLEVSAAARDHPTSEVAAALAFKAEAEARHNKLGDTAPSSALTTETALSFFDFYKSRNSKLSMELEHESESKGSKNSNKAHLMINGEPAGPPVTLKTKKQAESVAYLVAAVKITNENPEMLQDFERALKKGKGKILRDMMSIDLEASFDMLGSMKQSLISAREEGLPDHRSSLGAEDAQQLHDSKSRRSARTLSADDAALASKRLLEQQNAFAVNPELAQLRDTKAKLPMNEYRGEVLKMITNSQYSIVQGMTGSGKTTQVPQILLEDAVSEGRGGNCNIVCTQPRRIAATSVAQRVAAERNESLQETVGYHVRGDVKLPLPGGSINYCTTGILLEQLKHDADNIFDSVSHIIIDEVHERDLNIDFLMVVLRKAIAARLKDGKAVPKVVLMSATLDSELFAGYFASNNNDVDGASPCPSIAVPGRTFPVKERHLGRIMQDLFQAGAREVNGLIDTDRKCRDYVNAETAFSASHEKSDPEPASETVIDWKRQALPSEEGEPSAAQEKEEALVPIPLVAATLAHICRTTEDGAILVFFPGLDEILKTRQFLLEHKIFGLDFNNTAKFKILPLHSTVPKEEQAEIFNPAPEGCRKIILSTNIAETSVTVADVKYVVDTGKLREKRYDQVRRITKLQCVWESKSNAKQRAGRAGRVQDGFYYALFSKERHDSLRTVGLPELLRSDLQETCLDIKAQNFKEPVAEFLAQAIEPPAARSIEAAVENLTGMEAFTEGEELTDLGRLLSKLPIHPTLGKMIVLGIIFRCLDPMLVLGAAAEERSMFLTPIEKRQQAKEAHKSYAMHQSDHLAFLAAFRELHTLRSEQGIQTMMRRASEKFLHIGAFKSIDQTAQQIYEILTETGLIPRTTYDQRGGASLYSHRNLNRNSNNASMIKCLLLAGNHPNLAAKYTSKGLTYRTPSEQSVLMHPSSLNALSHRSDQHPYGTLFAYSTLARSNDGNTLYMRDSTQITPLMATLFGGKLRMHSGNRLEMDDWLPFFVKAEQRQFATKLILEFRKALDRVLNLAFKSLSAADPRARGKFADDPVREVFATGLVQALDQASALQHYNHVAQREHGGGVSGPGWGDVLGKDGSFSVRRV